MSTWLAVFRAELIRALPFLPWVAGLHALMLYIRCSWGFVLSPRLTGIIEWSTWLLAAVILVPSVRADSPFRRERFMATRPASPRLLQSAKFAGLLVAVVLPFVLVEFLSLAKWGEPIGILLLGTLQPAIFGFVVVAPAIPLLWYWNGKTASIFGLLLVLLSAMGTIILVTWFQDKRNGRPWMFEDGFPLPLFLLLAIAFTGLLLGLLLVTLSASPKRSRTTAKNMLVIPAAGIAACAAGWVAARPRAADRGEPAPLVTVSYHIDGFGAWHRHLLGVSPPAPAPAPGEEVSRSFTKLKVGGKNVLPRIRNENYSSSDEGESFVSRGTVQEALRHRFGEMLTLPPARRSDVSPAWCSFTWSKKIDERPSLDLALQETRRRWEVVGEMPIQPAASFDHLGNHWRLEAHTPSDGQEPQREQILLRWKRPVIWLRRDSPHRFYDADYRLAAVDREGFVFNVIVHGVPEKSGARSTLQEIGLAIYLGRPYDPRRKNEEPVIDPGGSPWPEDTRLVILRSVPVSRQTYTWESPPVIPLSSATLSPDEGNLPEWIRRTRLGLGASNFGFDTILAAPEETGYSESEWLAYFRLFPSAQAYRALRGKFLPAEIIDRQADGFIALYTPVDEVGRAVDPPELALARGHAEAPVWYHRWISQWGSNHSYDSDESAGRIRRAFTPPPSADSAPAVIDWFFKQDPGRFVFDPATGKYQTR